MKKLILIFVLPLFLMKCDNKSSNTSSNFEYNLNGYTFTLDSIDSFVSDTECSGDMKDSLDLVTQYYTNSEFLKSYSFSNDSVFFIDNSNNGLSFSSCPSWNDEYDGLWEISGNSLNFQAGDICWGYDEFTVTSDTTFYIDGEPICCQIYGTLESINGYSCSIFNGTDKEECENQGDDYYWINCYRKNYKGVSDEIN